MKTYGRYYNFNKIMLLNHAVDFNDADHLNHTGVKKFSSKLLSISVLK